MVNKVSPDCGLSEEFHAISEELLGDPDRSDEFSVLLRKNLALRNAALLGRVEQLELLRALASSTNEVLERQQNVTELLERQKAAEERRRKEESTEGWLSYLLDTVYAVGNRLTDWKKQN